MSGDWLGAGDGRGDRPGGRWGHQTAASPLVVLANWKLATLLGVSVLATVCLAGECPCKARSSSSPRTTLTGHAGMVGSVAFGHDGGALTSVGFNGTVVLWDLATGRGYPLPPVGAGQEHCVAFSPDGKLLATGSPTAAVALHDLEGHEARGLCDQSSRSAGAECLAIAPDGATLAVGQQDGRITLWDIATGRERSDLQLRGHAEVVASLAFSPDSATLASSGGDRTVRLWELASGGRERFAIDGQASMCVSLAFSPDGRLLALADQRSPLVRLRDVASGTERAVLHGPAGDVLAVSISPDGTTLAAAGFQGLISFWDLATLRPSPVRLEHAGVRSLGFAPDGRALASGGFDGSIHIWDWPPKDRNRE